MFRGIYTIFKDTLEEERKNKMKQIYIVLTHTGTALSTIIKYYTKDEFSHVSISLDEELEEMYSFGRLNPYNPFWGGFVHESIKNGTFKRFKNTRTEIYSLNIEDEQYNRLVKIINHFKMNTQKYSFNILGLACVSIKRKIRRKNNFYCAEFVKHVLKSAGITSVAELPEIIKPEDFKKIEGLQLEYKGLLKKYIKRNKPKIKDLMKSMNNKMSYI